jgi:hypothetical protein
MWYMWNFCLQNNDKERIWKHYNKSIPTFFTEACFMARKMCCTLMIQSVEQQLLDRWYFFDDFYQKRFTPQGSYGCYHCTPIMIGKLMTWLDTLSAVLLKLHDLFFVDGFLVPQPWIPDATFLKVRTGNS